MGAKLTAELNVKVGSSTAAVNALASRIRQTLAPLSQFERAGKKLQNSFAPIGSLLGGFAPAILLGASAAGLLAEGMRRAFEAGDRLASLNFRTGLPVAQAVVLEQAFKNAGMAVEEVGPMVNKLQHSLQGFSDEGIDVNTMAGRLGLNLRTLKKESPSDQIKDIGSAISSLSDPTERSAAAMAFFGKEGGKMLAIFRNSGAMDTAARQVGMQAMLLQQDAGLFSDITSALNSTGIKLQGFFVGMADSLAPLIEPLIELFQNTDFAAAGQAFGQEIRTGITGILDGSIWEIYAESGKIALANVANFFTGALIGVAIGMAQSLVSAFHIAVAVFEVLGTPGFWSAMGHEMLAWVDRFAQLFYNIFAGIADLLKPLLSKVGMGGVGESMSKWLHGAADSSGKAADQHSAAADKLASPLNTKIEGSRIKGWHDVMEAGGKGYQAGQFISTQGMSDKMNAKISALYNKSGSMTKEEEARRIKAGRKTKDEGDYLAPQQGEKSYQFANIGGFGLFEKNVLAKDPMISRADQQISLLGKIVANTTPNKPTQKTTPDRERFGY